MSAVFSALARNRWYAVGLALLVEAPILAALGLARPLSAVGLPAAVACAIAGTVAVVSGPLEGAFVAAVGATVFGSVGGWGAGELTAIALWPSIVVVVGVFARRIEWQRRAFVELMTAQEAERTRVALELHEKTAQTLAGALLALKRAETAAADQARASGAAARDLIQSAIADLRRLAVELRPSALDDLGLGTALAGLAMDATERTGVVVDLELDTEPDRLPHATEVTIYRALQEVLTRVAGPYGGRAVRIRIHRDGGSVRVVIAHDLHDKPGVAQAVRLRELAGLRERVRAAGGRFSARSGSRGTIVRFELPLDVVR